MGTENQDKPVEYSADQPQKNELSDEELKTQGGEALPDREAMSLLDLNLAAPVNAAVAANVLSDNSTAVAEAQQSNDITQNT